MTTPAVTTHFENIPSGLRELKNWVVYVDEWDRHIPYQPGEWLGGPPAQPYKYHASCKSPHGWVSFDEAVREVSKGHATGISFVLTEKAEIVGVDLDDVRNSETGEIEPWAQKIIEESDSYTEISPSGKGIRIFGYDGIDAPFDPNGAKKRGRVEIYRSEKILTVTGNVIEGRNSLKMIAAGSLQKRLAHLDPNPPKTHVGVGGGSTGNSESEEDWKIVGRICDAHPEFTAEEVEQEIQRLDSMRYVRRQRAKRDHSGKTYWRYTIDRYFERHARVAAVHNADTTSAVVVEENLPSITESSVRPDMPEAVLDGRLGEIYQKRLNRFPIAYAWPALVTLGGALIPAEEPIADHGTLFSNRSPFRPTLYAALMGPVGSGKSQAIEQAAAALGVAEPILCTVKAGSAEGLAPMLDAHGAARVLNPDELGHLLDKAKIEGASFPRILNSLYYHSREQLVIAKGRTVAFDCRLSVIGGVVEEDFGNVFGASTVHGLYSRMIFGLCPEPWQYLYRPPEGGTEQTSPTPVSVNSDVWAARDEWVKTHGIHPRDAENTLRVAYVCACFDGRDLNAKDLGPALEFAKQQTRFRAAFSPTQGPTLDAQCSDRIMRALTTQGNDWVTLRWLNRKIHANRDYGPAVFNRAVQNLAYTGELDIETGGRSKIVRMITDGEVSPTLS